MDKVSFWQKCHSASLFSWGKNCPAPAEMWIDFLAPICLGNCWRNNLDFLYRVSHCKVNKVIWLCWGYRFWFLLIFFILHVDEIWPFMPNPSLFIFLMFHALYGSISQHLLFLNKFWIILTFRGLFQVIKSNKPSKMYIFPLS